MSEAILFLAAPFAMSLILVGIHCSLGIHVLARGVLFVDLALAQVAVLGGLLPGLFWHDAGAAAQYAGSLLATLACSAYLTVSNRVDLSQEGMIGVIYAFSSAVVMLIFHAMPHGQEHLVHSMSGQILFCSWGDVAKVAIVYAAVSWTHWLLRRPLLRASSGKAKPWQDFVFYALFGVVISSSVRVAGVLIVFTFLIVPALLSSLWFPKLGARLAFGWLFGIVMSLAGMVASYSFDWPTGPTFVVVFSLPLLLAVPLRMRRAAP